MKLAPASSYFQNLKQKKLIIPLVLLTVVLFFLAFYTGPNSKSPQRDAITPAPSSTDNRIQPPPGTDLLKWIEFDAGLFTIKHAPDWFVEKGTMATGGEFIIIKPSALPEGINYPQLNIQSEPLQSGRLDQKISILKAFSPQEISENILGIKATKLSGTIPFKKVNNSVLNDPVQQTAYILSHKNHIITIKYTYEGSSVNSDLETYFREVINGIKLK